MKKQLMIASALVGLAGNAAADDLSKVAFSAWLGEAEALDAMCAKYEITQNNRDKLIGDAGLANSDLEVGGPYFRPYLTAKTNASDKFATLSASDACYHLNLALGEEGYVTEGALN